MTPPLPHAYGSAHSPAKDPRTAESAVLARITARLHTAAARGRDGFPQLAVALNDNRRFWTAAAADLADDGNGLPADLRAGMISLAGFVLAHSSRVLAGEAAAEPLIEVNRAVIHGLSAQALAA
ncbi:flagellar biosynthesis regulator FlaF [Paracoccus sp. S-4012]|uniref:flagellar biosynthesis regulator FlaF n=1 Tax=Paracoccus sp. S-4012 TaxID=2665648 RepID=UPI0012B121A3|nr:flagellar biosynthesis regulator FlaF [Paracoccus sp. S-4012]MRX49018.1 flagellar biosynthesis regulator FlaF [Paracoccus sp. S-4012]